jgi:hypothetical protein
MLDKTAVNLYKWSGGNLKMLHERLVFYEFLFWSIERFALSPSCRLRPLQVELLGRPCRLVYSPYMLKSN